MELKYLTWNPGFISNYHGNKICQIKHYLKNLKNICFVNIIVFLFYNSVLHKYIYCNVVKGIIYWHIYKQRIGIAWHIC